MPTLWADGECGCEDLSARFWDATASHRERFKELRFAECAYRKIDQPLNPLYRDSGAIFYWDQTRQYLGQLLYVRVHSPPPIDADKEVITVLFTAAFERGCLACTNGRHFFDGAPNNVVIRVSSTDPFDAYQRLIENLRERQDSPRRFSDLHLLQNWFDEATFETFQERVRRGLFIRMTDSEVESALRRVRATQS
jgi:hypothetical protein